MITKRELKHLIEKAKKLSAALEGRLAEIESLKAEEARELAAQDVRIDQAGALLELSIRQFESMIGMADGLVAQAKAKEMEACKLRTQAEALRLEADCVVDSGKANLTASLNKLSEMREEYKLRLQQAQDGKTRRKRAELARVLDRIAKAEQANKASASDILYGGGLRNGYGTPPPPIPEPDSEAIKPKMSSKAALTLATCLGLANGGLK